MTLVQLVREPDDEIAEVRISLGTPRGQDAFYLVFRGEPEKVVELLKQAHAVAAVALPNGTYQDMRRPQG